ncbi:MAG: TIM barrel protein [Armatimonadetes bacterium]|nr:TIM barrel protein [Armatimonadota bacterium]
MQTTESNLARLETDFSGYLEGDRVTELLKTFDIRFSAGHWCAGDFSDRFCKSYTEDPEFQHGVLHDIRRVSEAGVEGIELSDTLFRRKDLTFDRELEEAAKHVLETQNVIATNMNINVWTHAKWRVGGITHPDPTRRYEAIQYCLEVVGLAERMGCPMVQLWPGSDGWDYCFEVDYGRQFDWFLEGCSQIAKAASEKGLKFSVEAKQKEPREGNMILNTTAKAAWAAHLVNQGLGANAMGVVIDYGHEQMVGNTPADSLYLLRRIGVPINNFHINAAKYNSNDEDRITGTDDLWRLAEFCYAAIDTGYDGWFGEDQFTYRTDPVKSMALSRELFANTMKKALLIYRDRARLATARATGDATVVIDTVKRPLMNG